MKQLSWIARIAVVDVVVTMFQQDVGVVAVVVVMGCCVVVVVVVVAVVAVVVNPSPKL